MSGVKKVTDVAAKAGKAIDWDGLAKMLVSDEARKEFANLRRTFEDVNHQLQTKFSQEPKPIDWEYYKKGIGSKVVDMYKEAYDSMCISYSPSTCISRKPVCYKFVNKMVLI
uniref:ATP synthase subunit d, mitochondrial n=1 Tax=Triticum urartu TaxID=4572 RepID=A0A8R7TIC2_TRIUA